LNLPVEELAPARRWLLVLQERYITSVHWLSLRENHSIERRQTKKGN